MATVPVYQFYAALDYYKPVMWRRFQTSGDVTMARLAYIVMSLFEMKAQHLVAVEHERPLFGPSGRRTGRMECIGRYDIPDETGDWEDFGGYDATKVTLAEVPMEELSTLDVMYDFGDNWHVRLTREEPDGATDASKLPHVLDGAGYGIIEDCGGVGGLEDIAAAFKAKKGKAYKEYREWLETDDLDLGAFDRDDADFRLKKVPGIYEKIYEKHKTPTRAEINLLERRYAKKG